MLWEAISQSILTHLVGDTHGSVRQRPGSLGSAALSRTLGYINDNLDGDVSIEAMADIAGLSPFISAGPSPARRDIRRIVRHARPRRAGGGASTRKLAAPCGDRFPNGLRRSEPHGAACSTVPRHFAQGAFRLAGAYNYRDISANPRIRRRDTAEVAGCLTYPL